MDSRRQRPVRPMVLRVSGTGSAPGDIPPSAGVEIHSGVPGWTEIQPGEWMNESGGTAYGRYFLVADVSQWNVDLCAQDANGEWYCLEAAYTPVATTTTGNAGQQPTQPPVDVKPETKPTTPTQEPVAVVAQTVDAPAENNSSWLWLLLLALYLLSQKDK